MKRFTFVCKDSEAGTMAGLLMPHAKTLVIEDVPGPKDIDTPALQAPPKGALEKFSKKRRKVKRPPAPQSTLSAPERRRLLTGFLAGGWMTPQNISAFAKEHDTSDKGFKNTLFSMLHSGRVERRGDEDEGYTYRLAKGKGDGRENVENEGSEGAANL